MLTLLWKEWREHAWKLAFAMLLLGATSLIGLRARIIADEELLQILCTAAVLLLPLLAGTGMVPPERSDGSLDTLLALPIKSTWIFLAKTIMGAMICIAPLLVAAGISIFVAQGREMPALSILHLYARTLAATLFLYFWILTLTVGLEMKV